MQISYHEFCHITIGGSTQTSSAIWTTLGVHTTWTVLRRRWLHSCQDTTAYTQTQWQQATQLPRYNSLYADPMTAGYTAAKIQQLIRRPSDSRRGCPGATELGSAEHVQLRVSTFPSPASRVRDGSVSGGGGQMHVIAPRCMSSTKLVQDTPKAVVCSTNSSSPQFRCIPEHGNASRSPEEPKVADLCLADLWKERLKDLGWSVRACQQLPLCWAESTLGQYNRSIHKLTGILQAETSDISSATGWLCMVRGLSLVP